ncbi:nuclear pore complex protein Nup153-like isoform X2 [Xenia sp. Carnegie-2017]|uniref:nuclear pore complex protein Nup153-like isoform X2 n=1 Tax=Xenia sp. Carnegie-2017 TaxID=2897299 RepID=UPI001F03625D|nr:nuclear pore complex protein Nup153-like isoform X2 [Xenia sp. Carnegie-2017]
MVDQPNQKSYKIRGHSRQRRSSKPYLRPNEAKNKGIFDKVKEYFNPSWLVGYFSSSKDDSEEYERNLDSHATVTHEEGSASNVREPIQHASSYVAEEDENEDSFESFENDSEQSLNEDDMNDDLTVHDKNDRREKLDNRDHSIRLSGSLDDDFEDAKERQKRTVFDSSDRIFQRTDHLTRKPLPSLLHSRAASSSLLLQRGMHGIRNKGNLFSANSGGSTTSRMKFSSTPITAHDTGESSANLVNDKLARHSLSARNLSINDRMSTRNETPKMASVPEDKPSRTSSLPALSTTNSTPLFSVEKFVTPVQRSFKNKRVGSPNYPGPVIYGGALNVSREIPFKRRKMSTSPGSESHHPVSKLRIRGVKQLSTQSAAAGRSSTKTAQRILDALESVSSPLKDVRRIPAPISLASASPLSFIPSKTRTIPPKTKVGPRVSYLQAKLIGDPPVSSLQTPDVAKVSFVEEPRESTEVQSDPSPSTTRRPSNPRSQDSTFFSDLNDVVLKTSLPGSLAPKSLPTSLSPIENTKKSGGKMKSAPRREAMHYSSNKNSPESEVANPLPEINNAIPLPVNLNKNLSFPMFNSSKTLHSNNDVARKSFIDDKQKKPPSCERQESPRNGFLFSSPETESRKFSVKECLETADNEVSFSFSEPAPVKVSGNKKPSRSSSLQSSKSAPLLYTSPTQNSVSLFSKSPQSDDAFSPSRNDVMSTPEEIKNPESVNVKNFVANIENTAPCQWKKPVETCKSSFAKKENQIGNLKKLEAPKGTSDSNTKQAAVLKPKFAAPKDLWECPTCMIQNKNDILQCPACQTSKPGSVGPSQLQNQTNSSNEGSTSGGFSFTSGKVNSTSSGGGFTFGNVKSASSGGGLSGKDVNSTSSGGGFTFGNVNSASSGGGLPGKDVNATSSGGGFTFGNVNSASSGGEIPSKDVNATSSGGGFTFGNVNSASSGGEIPSKDVNATSSGGEIPSKDVNATSSGGGFTLGNVNSTSSHLKSKTDNINKDSSSGGFSFANTRVNPIASGGGVTSTDVSSISSGGGFNFGASQTNQSTNIGSTFTFGQNKTTESSNFTFGSNNVTKSDANVTSTSEETKSSVIFSFGAGKSDENSANTIFSSAASSSKNIDKQIFSFGAPSSQTTTDNTLNTKKESQKSNLSQVKQPTMNIAQAAAVGLLKVPGKEIETSEPVNKDIRQTNAGSTFAFPTSANTPSSLKTGLEQTAGSKVTNAGSTFAFTTSANAPSSSKSDLEQTAGSKVTNQNQAVSLNAGVSPFSLLNKNSVETKTPGGLFKFGVAPSTTSTATLSTVSVVTPITTFLNATGSTIPQVSPLNPSSTPKNTPFSFTGSLSQPKATVASAVPSFDIAASTSNKTAPLTQTNPSTFSFLGSAATQTTKATPAFNFGAVNGPTSSNGVSSTPTAATTSGLFSFTGSQPPVLPTQLAVENSNSMGGEEMDADSNSNHGQSTFIQNPGGFNFSSAVSNTGQTPGGVFGALGNSSTAPSAQSGGFNFSANTGASSTFQFGSSSSSMSGGFNFGASAPSSNTTPFMFGSSSTSVSGSTNQTSTPLSFSFGGNGIKPAQNPTPAACDKPALFSMGAGQTTPSNRVFKKAVRRKRK